MKCPQPVLKIAVAASDVNAGDIVEITGDCPTFENDIKAWCERMHKVCLSVRDEGNGTKTLQIQF
jgi:tRNA 2-thiouridine synthesizing protein A